ncbi:uncharacterized protein LOC110807824 [Carica papaya]|uniref:uncharacterized protein LOC110807824 n=1 Tax=Carica papaya TaxID=3649 RepID=UPI000B8C85CB|nr:uncharacterized protein LOC110807824 [Carica papaya]
MGVPKGLSLSGFKLGLIIRAVTLGHIPPTNFILVTMGSTAVLLVGWRTMVVSTILNETSKKTDVYRHGSPFELFENLSFLCKRGASGGVPYSPSRNRKPASVWR